MLQANIAQKRQAQNEAINTIRASIRTLPAPEQKACDHESDEEERSILLGILSYRQHEQRN